MSAAEVVWILPDSERIAAARWAARELLLGHIAGRGPAGWTTRIDAKGGITSKSPHAPRSRR